MKFGELFDDFFNSEVRNAVFHSDYILTDSEFRSRKTERPLETFSIGLDELNDLIADAKAFIISFLRLERSARSYWGQHKNTAIPFDPHYKAFVEIITAENDELIGMRILWPNSEVSTFSRSDKGVQMTNCMLRPDPDCLEFIVGLYARNPGSFSPLVEDGQKPTYAPLLNGGIIEGWSEEIQFFRPSS